MLKNCIFHEPVIICGTLYRLASCPMSNVFTQLYLLVVLSFNRSRKIFHFPKIVTFLILDDYLQPFG